MPLSKRKKLPLRWDEMCVCACVCGLISFIALSYTVEKIRCDQCYWWAADHRHWKYRCLQADTHCWKDTHTHTHTEQTALTCSYCGGFACSTKLAYSDESSHAFGHANRSERVHMVLRMPSSPDLLFSSSSVVLPLHHRLQPSSQMLINKT